MSAALTKVQTWLDGKQLPPLEQNFAWLQRFPVAYWQMALACVLTLVLALSLARLFWLIFTPTLDPVPSSQLAAVSSSQQSTVTATVDIATLKSLDLFGNADVAASQPEQNAQQNQPVVIAAEETKLNLLLKGIVGSNQADAARAIIANGNDQDIYAPGDKMPVGSRVTLDRVLTDKVILNNNGRYESLSLYEEGQSFASSSSTANTSSTNRVPQRQTVRTQPQVQIPESARQAISQGNIPETINDVIKLTVAREGGEVIGYRVRPGRYRQLFDEFGFVTGDIVTHVNSIGVDDPSKAMEVYREIRTAESATFDVLRDGEALNLDVDLTELDLAGEG